VHFRQYPQAIDAIRLDPEYLIKRASLYNNASSNLTPTMA